MWTGSFTGAGSSVVGAAAPRGPLRPNKRRTRHLTDGGFFLGSLPGPSARYRQRGRRTYASGRGPASHLRVTRKTCAAESFGGGVEAENAIGSSLRHPVSSSRVLVAPVPSPGRAHVRLSRPFVV